jgi:hypothetical protein
MVISDELATACPQQRRKSREGMKAGAEHPPDPSIVDSCRLQLLLLLRRPYESSTLGSALAVGVTVDGWIAMTIN